ncbi:hypothetical protein B0T20DRAFT_273569 [Sordaria brevicollis]|uniref:Uncharacterized protein n=1 Tax=Sordaria brevicollis TaxID=83679 RepID=A0AAE0PAP1_SORBR|nr:hypothetical protein B0T20DRAFT_273569 [Sordaria brevicollis]
MTGKRFTEEQRLILERMLTLKDKLKNHEIAFIMGFDERTIRRRRYEYEANGKIAPPPDVSKNAEKLKPETLQKLLDWLKDNDHAIIEDMQKFLKEACNCNVSRATISRQLKKATKEDRQLGRVKRLKERAKMAAEGRDFDFTTVSSTTSPNVSASVAPQESQSQPQEQHQHQTQLQEPGHQQQQQQPRHLPPGQRELPAQLQQQHQTQQPSSHRPTLQAQHQQQPEARFEPYQPLGGAPGDFHSTPEQALLSLSRTQPPPPPPPPQQGHSPPPSMAHQQQQQQAGTV